MYRKLLFLPFLFFTVSALAQNPATVIQLSQKDIVIPCGATCTSITARVPHIRGSDEYVVQTIPYIPFAYEGGGTELTALYTDDIYSSTIPLPFAACFYGARYTSLVVGSNGIVTFDVTNAGKRNNFRQTVSFSNTTPVPIPYSGGTQNSLSSTYYPKAAIMGVYHDIYPTLDNGKRRIEWRIEGAAPKRRFIASFKDVAMYGNNCNDLLATHQIVVYESTGVVEVYVQDKPVCTAWNEGLAVLGLQNFSRTKGAFPAGKNTGRWGGGGMQEAYRFTPAAGEALFKKAELYWGNTVVATADTASGPDGELELNFAQVCPAEDSGRYVLRVTYQACNSTEEISFDDTLTITREKLSLRLQTENATCTAGGSILVNATGIVQPLLYSLNGGPAQASPQFTNLPAGNYTVAISGSGTCQQTATTTLSLVDDLLLVAQPAATVCAGETLTPQILSNATAFHWSPSTGVSNTAEAHPEIKTQNSTVYTLTATRGICRETATLAVTVMPLPVVNAGADKTIIQGDKTELLANASAGTVEWSPADGLSAAAVLNPLAMPLSTTTYTLTATDNGCIATDAVTITVVPYCVKPMEAFSPNGDGINDLWLVTNGSCLKAAKVEVFNRYGGKVFQHNDYKNNWNGTFNGNPLPDGTYYYIITYQLINGQFVHQKGNVTILR